MVPDLSVFRWYRDGRLVCVDFDTDPTQSGLSRCRGDLDRSVLRMHCLDGTNLRLIVEICTMFQTCLWDITCLWDVMIMIVQRRGSSGPSPN